MEKEEEISLCSGSGFRPLEVEPVGGEENNVDHDQEHLERNIFSDNISRKNGNRGEFMLFIQKSGSADNHPHHNE